MLKKIEMGYWNISELFKESKSLSGTEKLVKKIYKNYNFTGYKNLRELRQK